MHKHFMWYSLILCLKKKKTKKKVNKMNKHTEFAFFIFFLSLLPIKKKLSGKNRIVSIKYRQRYLIFLIVVSHSRHILQPTRHSLCKRLQNDSISPHWKYYFCLFFISHSLLFTYAHLQYTFISNAIVLQSPCGD